MKKVILMALAAASMFFVSCNDDEKSSGGEDVRHSFELSASVDTTIVQAGKSVGTTFVLSGMPEDDKVNMSFSLNFLEDDYKGSFVYDGQTFYEGQDLSALFFGGDTLRLDFVTSAKVTDSGKIDVVAIANTLNFTALDTFSVFLKKPFSAEMLTKDAEIGINQSVSLKLRINEEFYNGKDEYQIYCFISDMSKEAGANGHFNFGNGTKVKPNEDISISYVPETIGQHFLVFEIVNADNESFIIFANVTAKTELVATWSSTDCTSDGLFSIKSGYGGDAYKGITFMASEKGYSGNIYYEYTASDDKIYMYQHGTTKLVAGQRYQYPSNTALNLSLGAIGADPTKLQTFTVRFSDDLGNTKDLTFSIKYKLQVKWNGRYTDYSDYVFKNYADYYDYGTVLILEAGPGLENTNKTAVGWYLNGTYQSGSTQTVTIDKNYTIYPKIEQLYAYIKIGEAEAIKYPANTSYQGTTLGRLEYGQTITLKTSKGKTSPKPYEQQRKWQFSKNGTTWLTMDMEPFNFDATSTTITLTLQNRIHYMWDLDLPQGGTVYFRYSDRNGN